jgi:hypothetical protein
VHRGFYNAFMDVRQQVLNAVTDYKQKYGHSNVV